VLRAVKNYFAFTSWVYRLVVFFLMPLLSILYGNLGVITGGEVPGIVFQLPVFMLVIVVECITDYWFMGSFYSKHNSSLEYLQTSNRFKNIIKDVVVVDIIRRFITGIALYGVFVIIAWVVGEPLHFYQGFAFLPLYSFVMVMIANFISRHFNIVQYVYLAATLTMMVTALGFVPMEIVTENVTFWTLGILLVLCVVVSVITVWYSLKKVRDSYYDK